MAVQFSRAYENHGQANQFMTLAHRFLFPTIYDLKSNPKKKTATEGGMDPLDPLTMNLQSFFFLCHPCRKSGTATTPAEQARLAGRLPFEATWVNFGPGPLF